MDIFFLIIFFCAIGIMSALTVQYALVMADCFLYLLGRGIKRLGYLWRQHKKKKEK